MEVLYAGVRLRDLCESERELRKHYGAEGARKVGQRIQALRTAESLDDVMRGPGRCHPLKGDYEDCYALSLHQGWRLVFRLATDEERVSGDVTDEQAALVIEIIDYHEG